MMTKTALITAVALGLGVASTATQASLVAGTLLTIEPGVQTQVLLVDPATGEPFIDPATGEPVVDPATGEPYMVDGPFVGSSFSMGDSRVPIGPGSDGGVIIGQVQPGGGTHGGPPNGSETAPIDAAWGFFCNTGLHYTTAPLTVVDEDVNSDGGFTKSLDMSGWNVSWSSIPQINMGGNLATLTCSLADCAAGSSYTLDYAIPVPPSTQHGFGGVGYALHLEGTISAVPVPAAVWLFGSGLVGLVGVARRKRRLQ